MVYKNLQGNSRRIKELKSLWINRGNVARKNNVTYKSQSYVLLLYYNLKIIRTVIKLFKLKSRQYKIPD